MTHQQAVDGMASERYLLDEMSEVERFEFEAHYFDCVDCAEDVRLAHVIREEAQRGAARPSVESAFLGRRSAEREGGGRTESDVVSFFGRRSANRESGWRRPMVALPWAAAAGLAMMVSYQSLVTVPELRDAVAPESLTPVMLRGATRGAAPVVTLADGQRFVTLSIDLVSPPQTGALRYELVRAGQPPLLSGDAPLPPRGASLLLLVPAVELERGARYSLIIRTADSANAVIGEYNFDVS
jgi:hypothetical protein